MIPGLLTFEMVLSLSRGGKILLNTKKIHTGCLIEFSNGKEKFLASVIEVRSYPTLEAYLNDVTFQMALPGISSFEEAAKVYYQWSTPDEIEKHGFLGIFIKPITEKVN